jgi:hypothetical protein
MVSDYTINRDTQTPESYRKTEHHAGRESHVLWKELM